MSRLRTGLQTAALVIVLGSVLFFFSCGRYQLTRDDKGRVVRLDRLTGSMAYVSGPRLVPMENPRARRKALDSLAVARDWGRAQYEQYLFALRTSWRNDKMYYQLGIAPMPPERAYNFSIVFVDDQNFELASIPLNVPDGVRTPDGIVYSGAIAVDEDVYRSLRAWTPRPDFYYP